MTQEKVETFIMTNSKYFPEGSLFALKDKLLNLDDSKSAMLYSLEFKDPTTMIIVSFFLGGLGVDRFMLGDTGLGILKLLTCGVCGIMSLIDLFLVGKRAREKNYEKLTHMLNMNV